MNSTFICECVCVCVCFPSISTFLLICLCFPSFSALFLLFVILVHLLSTGAREDENNLPLMSYEASSAHFHIPANWERVLLGVANQKRALRRNPFHGVFSSRLRP